MRVCVGKGGEGREVKKGWAQSLRALLRTHHTDQLTGLVQYNNTMHVCVGKGGGGGGAAGKGGRGV